MVCVDLQLLHLLFVMLTGKTNAQDDNVNPVHLSVCAVDLLDLEPHIELESF